MIHFRNSQSGSAFFLILIAISLFAALSYIAMQGSRSSAGNLTQEQSRLAAQEIIAYGNTIASTVQRLKLSGCTDNQYDISNTVWIRMDNTTITHPVGQNPNAVADCKVFSAPGNAIPVTMPPTYFAPWAYGAAATKQGTFNIVRSAAPGVGNTANDDLLLRLPFVKKEICLKINEMLGITNPAGDAPGITGTLPNSLYIGTLGVNAPSPFSDPSGSFTGKTSFCIKTDVSGVFLYEYDHVLLAR